MTFPKRLLLLTSLSIRLRESQFPTLVRHFFIRLIDPGIVSPNTEARLGTIDILAFLSVPGLMLCFWESLIKYARVGRQPLAVRLELSSIDRVFFIYCSMLVIGFITVLKWDILFPDRSDHLNLTPLPIRLRTLFAAKIAALLLFLGLFSASTNFFSTLLFPMMVTAGEGSVADVARFTVAHALAILAANAFVFFSLIALQGMSLAFLSRSWFARVSRLAQLLLAVFFLISFLTYPRIFQFLQDSMRSGAVPLELFPPIWFLALYDVLLGHHGTWFEHLADRALIAVGLAATLAAITYAIGYRRQILRCLEVTSERSAISGPIQRAGERIMNRWLLPDPVERALYDFFAATMARSQSHQLVVGAFVAVGLAVSTTGLIDTFSRGSSLSTAGTSAALLSVILALHFLVLVGLRIAFTFPIDLKANWAFQLSKDQDMRRHLSAARKFMVLRGVIPVTVLSGSLYAWIWPWRVVLLHLGFAVTLAVLLVEFLTLGLVKIPFTCSHRPGKANIKVMWPVYWLAFSAYSFNATAAERWMLQNPSRFVWYYAGAFLLLAGLTIYRRRRRPQGLIYEDLPEPAVLSLNLNG